MTLIDSIIGTTKLERIATGTLAAATAIVGASIIADGDAARAVNGLAGLTWFASSALFLAEGRRRDAAAYQWIGVTALTAAVAFVVRPTDATLAIAGFLPAGALAAWSFAKSPVFWAKMVPALYLPMHIGTAILKAAGRNLLGMESHIRTEPPPTAAVVPFVMLVAATAGGVLIPRFARGRKSPARA